MKAVLFYHLGRGNAAEVARQVCTVLHENGIEIWADPQSRQVLASLFFVQYAAFDQLVQRCDFAIAIGGDGTILHCGMHLVGTSCRLLGVNTGRLGFLATLEPNHLDRLSRLRTGDYRVSHRMLLKGIIYDAAGRIVRCVTAINDISLNKQFARVCELVVSRNGTVLGEYRTDGILFSTPTGSTAYALSAGGPVIEPEFSCIEMNLICPHALSARPILFSPETILEVRCADNRDNALYYSADGEEPVPFPEGYTLRVTGAKESLQMLDLSGNTFFDSLSRKLMQSLKEGNADG